MKNRVYTVETKDDKVIIVAKNRDEAFVSQKEAEEKLMKYSFEDSRLIPLINELIRKEKEVCR